jgi:hypothetical protein
MPMPKSIVDSPWAFPEREFSIRGDWRHSRGEVLGAGISTALGGPDIHPPLTGPRSTLVGKDAGWSVAQYVVRAGIAQPRTLIEGTAAHRLVRGLYGFSVQSAPGVAVEELALAGRFPHVQISVTTVELLQAHGFTVVFPTPGKGAYHATVRTPWPLALAGATLLSNLFTRRPNPYLDQ